MRAGRLGRGLPGRGTAPLGGGDRGRPRPVRRRERRPARDAGRRAVRVRRPAPRARSADRARLRAPRRRAAGAGREVDEPAVRPGREERTPVRARDGRRQGRLPRLGGGGRRLARRRRSASRQPPVPDRGRGGGGLGRPPLLLERHRPGAGRGRRRPLRHLQLRDGRPGDHVAAARPRAGGTPWRNSTCLDRPVHSGDFGGAVPDPVRILCGLLDDLRAPDGRIAVPGLYRRVARPSAAVRRCLRRLPFSDSRFRRGAGMLPGRGSSASVARASTSRSGRGRL